MFAFGLGPVMRCVMRLVVLSRVLSGGSESWQCLREVMSQCMPVCGCVQIIDMHCQEMFRLFSLHLVVSTAVVILAQGVTVDFEATCDHGSRKSCHNG